MGRSSGWRNLILKFAGDHINLEEEHNGRYKTHPLFTFFSYRLSWALMIYFWIYLSHYLGDAGHAFNIAEYDHLVNPSLDSDYPTRYESLYMVDKPQKY
mmetsp:Transcript_57899/g.87288  ORF Transcript_57899/g.87288 Transcript_57899/m.87288 type:complete len:99 (-) Transcript_57899:50-346(-)